MYTVDVKGIPNLSPSLFLSLAIGIIDNVNEIEMYHVKNQCQLLAKRR